jgi:hypothetical protein
VRCRLAFQGSESSVGKTDRCRDSCEEVCPGRPRSPAGLSGTFLDIIVVLVFGHKLCIPFCPLMLLMGGGINAIGYCISIIKSPHPIGGRGLCSCMHKPIVVPPPFAPGTGASTGSTPESKPPRYNGRFPKPATTLLPATRSRLEGRFTGWLRGVVWDG